MWNTQFLFNKVIDLNAPKKLIKSNAEFQDILWKNIKPYLNLMDEFEYVIKIKLNILTVAENGKLCNITFCTYKILAESNLSLIVWNVFF